MSLIVHVAAPAEGAEYGEPPVLVSACRYCEECGKWHEWEVCPRCDSTIHVGYGLACGPGFGLWKCCDRFCGWTWKRVTPDEADE